MPIVLRLLALLLAATLLAGCGWHLRGATTLPEGIDNVYIQAPNQALRDAWSVQLSESGVQVTDEEKEAAARLVVDAEHFDRRVLSVDPDTGKVREYALAYTATLHMERADGSILLEPQTVRQTRNFVFNETAVIGAQNEERTLRQEMRLSAMQQVQRRFQFAACRESTGPCAR